MFINSLAARQISQIRDGGWDVVKRKTGRLLIEIISMPIYLILFLLVLFIRLLRPLITIRFGLLDAGRIGGFISADWYLCEKAYGLHKKVYYDLFLLTQSTDHRNRFWIKIWKRSGLRIIDFGNFNYLVKSITYFNDIIPGCTRHKLPNDEHSWPPPENTLEAIINSKNISFITITKQEETFGVKALEEMGIPQHSPFICFHNRDSAFLNSVYPQRDWSYHNYRDSQIQNYLAAANEITERGYYAVRVGYEVEKKLSTNNPKIIDYASSSDRTDFLDIYLLAKCDFSIFSETGLNQIPIAFRRPLVFVNYVLIAAVINWNKGLFITKKVFSQKEKRYLRFKEVIKKVGICGDGRMFEENGLSFVENTAEEIKSVYIEMDLRLKGLWIETKEDENLQKRFWNLFGPNRLRNPKFRIGSQFLHENQDLLEV